MERTRMTEPTSIAASFKWLAVKFFSGVVGAWIISRFDPPQDRRTLFMQALCSGIGSLIFGGIVVRILSAHFEVFNVERLAEMDRLDVLVPVYFLVGAISWGAFGAVAKFRSALQRRGGARLADRILGPRSRP